MSFRLDIDINGCNYIVTGNNDQLPEVAAKLFPPVSTEPVDPFKIQPYEPFRLLYTGERKIPAIKDFRELTHCGLKEAKDAIEGNLVLKSEDSFISYYTADQLVTRLSSFGKVTVSRA